MGVCALCKHEAELIQSHLIPAAAYKHVRDTPEAGGGSPIRVDTGDKSAFQSDKQITQYLLCKVCEDLFSKNGEKIIGKLWWTRRSFPLLEKMQSHTIIGGVNEFLVYSHAAMDRRERDGLFYFAMSIFWRANVWSRNGQADAYRNALGEKYENQIRKFLLGFGSLDSAHLFIHLNTNSKFSSLIRLPTFHRKDGVTHHSFSILGIDFWLYLGGSVSKEIRHISHDRILFASSDFAKTNSLDKLAHMLKTEIIRKGKLANRI